MIRVSTDETSDTANIRHADRKALRSPEDGGAAGQSHLRTDRRTTALAELGALLATGAAGGCYERCVADVLAAGITADEMVDILVVLAPTVGLARLVPAAEELSLALGYDIDRALERLDDRRPGER